MCGVVWKKVVKARFFEGGLTFSGGRHNCSSLHLCILQSSDISCSSGHFDTLQCILKVIFVIYHFTLFSILLLENVRHENA